MSVLDLNTLIHEFKVLKDNAITHYHPVDGRTYTFIKTEIFSFSKEAKLHLINLNTYFLPGIRPECQHVCSARYSMPSAILDLNTENTLGTILKSPDFSLICWLALNKMVEKFVWFNSRSGVSYAKK